MLHSVLTRPILQATRAFPRYTKQATMSLRVRLNDFIANTYVLTVSKGNLGQGCRFA